MIDSVIIDTCEVGGHKFAKLPDHPQRHDKPMCPYCLVISFEKMIKRVEFDDIKNAMRNVKLTQEMYLKVLAHLALPIKSDFRTIEQNNAILEKNKHL